MGDGTLASLSQQAVGLSQIAEVYTLMEILLLAQEVLQTQALPNILFIDHSGGISASTTANGNIQVTGTRTFGVAANYIYNGTTP